MQLRKMTMGEVAEISGDLKETIRWRLNHGVSNHRKATGWARFDVPSTVQIAIHAEMIRRTGVNAIANEVSCFIGESMENFCGGFPNLIRRKGQFAECYLIFRRLDLGIWTRRWCRNQEDALTTLGEYMASTCLLEAAGFYFVNVETVADWAIDRIFDLQGIEADAAEVPK